MDGGDLVEVDHHRTTNTLLFYELWTKGGGENPRPLISPSAAFVLTVVGSFASFSYLPWSNGRSNGGKSRGGENEYLRIRELAFDQSLVFLLPLFSHARLSASPAGADGHCSLPACYIPFSSRLHYLLSNCVSTRLFNMRFTRHITLSVIDN